jgi:bifunctional non-homologous end joining protein LigD
MDDLLASLPEQAQHKLKQQAQPEWLEPMLATLTEERFSDEDWIFERKLDGQRCLAFREGDTVRLMSRNQQPANVQYPELVAAIGRQPRPHFIADGEVVAFEGDVTSFSKLQGRMHISDPGQVRQSDVDVYYYIFDLLYLDGYLLTRVDLRHRKAVLKQALNFDDPVRFMVHRNAEGEAYFEEACRKGWEGLIAKDATSRYVHGRSKKWLKFKCGHQQELVIGGYTEPHGKRIEFGALLLGYYAGNDFVYAGKVGTGFDHATLRRLGERLRELEQATSPYASDDVPSREVHWVKPELVAEIGFEEWTDEGKLRHPRYLGLRQDKAACEVVRESK